MPVTVGSIRITLEIVILSLIQGNFSVSVSRTSTFLGISQLVFIMGGGSSPRRCDLSPHGAPVRGSYQLGFKLRLG